MEPYLSVVVTTRNDDHGRNPRGRFQAFINCLTAQCQRVGLPAELIVVEWNPPADRPPLRDALRWPANSLLETRIIQVPAELHGTLKHAEALPLFQMIAKNVGIRRARGAFVLSTNIDILLSNALMDAIAERKLEQGVMYRVDRRDVEADVPVDGSLDEQLDYCRSHQLRTNSRLGTYPVTCDGAPGLWPDDIADATSGIHLGEGWHMREGVAGEPYRWVSERAEVTLEPSATTRFLNVEVESNPYVVGSNVEFSVTDTLGGQLLAPMRLSNIFFDASTVQVTVSPATVQRQLTFHGRSVDGRDWLPPGEDRDGLVYRVRRLFWDAELSRPRYALEGWRLCHGSGAMVTPTPAGLSVITSQKNLLYAIEYGPIVAPVTDTFRFWITLSIADGGVIVQALDAARASFLPITRRFFRVGGDRTVCEISLDLAAGQAFTLVISNARLDGDRASHFVLHEFHGSLPDQSVFVADAPAPPRSPWARLKSAIKARLRRGPVTEQSTGEQTLPVSVTPEPATATATPPTPANPLQAFLVTNRPERLHLNACGDFQLMSREDWFALGGYAEFEMYSMNIDGLLGHTAQYAGIREHIFEPQACVFHIEHEAGSGWTPEGETKLRKRIEERGIGWLDHSVVSMLASVMKSVGRPLVFNGANWGFAQHHLPEVVPSGNAISTN